MRWAVLMVVMTACSDLPWAERAPIVTSFEPATRRVGEAGQGILTGRNLKPAYNATLDEDSPLVVQLGGRDLPVIEINSEGTRVVVNVPSIGTPGTFELRVSTEGGEDTLPDAYTVTP